MAALDTLEREAAGPLGQSLTHLDRLEAESIHIMREVVAQCENPVMLYSVGKDSSVMLHLAEKAFFPSRPPFPLMHVDTTWKFKEMIAFRDRRAKEVGMELFVHSNPDGIRDGVGPFTHGSAVHTDIMKTQGLKQALDKYKFDAAFGGARRDEEKSRAKERIFSFRSENHRWDGCYPLTGAVESEAVTLPDVIQEMLLTTTSERQGRVIDSDVGASMEQKKEEGYF